MQQLTREQIISVCQTEPETFTAAYLALKTEVAELRAELQAVKDRLAPDSHNSHQPPSRDRGYISTNRKQGFNVLEALQNGFSHQPLLCFAL